MNNKEILEAYNRHTDAMKAMRDELKMAQEKMNSNCCCKCPHVANNSDTSFYRAFDKDVLGLEQENKELKKQVYDKENSISALVCRIGELEEELKYARIDDPTYFDVIYRLGYVHGKGDADFFKKKRRFWMMFK
jgi:hypothetical protein